MSGIEVAGLVLGAFPLLISALEHGRDTAKVLEIFWKIRRENLEALLLPLIVDDNEVQDLLKNPGGPRWQDPELEGRLKGRLPVKSYLLYLERISQIQEKVQVSWDMHFLQGHVIPLQALETNIGSQTNVRSNSNISLDGVKANLDFQARRIRMSFNQSKRDNLFKQLTKGNDELRDLLDTSDRIAAIRQSRGVAKETAETKGLWQFWRHTDKLYKLLSQSWLCECRRFHSANLLLQYRTSPTPDFRIFFFSGNYSKAEKPLWACQEAKIRMLQYDGEGRKPKRSVVNFAPDPVPPPSPASVATPVTTTTAPIPSPPIRAAQRSPSPMPSSSSKAESKEERKKSFRMSFLGNFKKGKGKGSAATVSNALLASPRSIQPADNVPATNSATATASATAASTETPEPPQIIVTNTDANSNQEKVGGGDRMIDIVNLCDEIPKFPTKADDGQPFCLKGDSCRVALNPVCPSRPAITSTTAWDTISLEALLRKDTPRVLTRRERYLISLTLASSYLQLKSSPWIHPEWSKRDILFLRSGPNPKRIRLDQPYISRHFEGADNAEDGDDDDDIAVPMGWLDRNDRTLVSLGIMLLELCFGTALEEHETRKRYNYHPASPEEASVAAADPFLDTAAALEWFQRVAEEAGPEFADAIDWCLKNMPGSGEFDGKLDRWREELFAKVVLPLKYCYDQFVAVRN
ncbi:hypothetical protein ARSEF4850_008513 [Beauveria asiatica]